MSATSIFAAMVLSSDRADGAKSRSKISSCPPGRNTRALSAKIAIGSAAWLSSVWAMTRSQAPLSARKLAAPLTSNAMWASTPSALAYWRAISIR
jgi:hypothetical protein